MPPNSDDLPASCDTFLRWGLGTYFEQYFRDLEPMDHKNSVGLMIEWKSPEDALAASRLLTQHEAFVPSTFLHGALGKPYLVWSVTLPAHQVLSFVSAAGSRASSIELTPPTLLKPTVGLLDSTERPQPSLSKEDVLVAVLDDGCAFANAHFLNANGEPRVVWVWNQNDGTSGKPLDSTSGPSSQCNFAYGSQWNFNDLKGFLLAAGSQELAYARAGLPGLRRAAAHGPHVMDLLCGDERWDIVFVQFPLQAIDDPTGNWLQVFALHALHYVVECAGSNTKKIIVNLSWGPQTGPHDGTHALETAINQLVAVQASLGHNLIVSVPIGNTYSAQAHAEIPIGSGGTVEWVVPPDGHATAFLEVWWPPNEAAANARLSVTPPGGIPVAFEIGTLPPQNGWRVDMATIGSSTKALIAIDPTELTPGAMPGPHGRWQIGFPANSALQNRLIHVYVARANHNMGAKRRAKASYLSDRALEKTRFVSPSDRHKEAQNSHIRREGTMSGIATGQATTVAAGYRISDLQLSPYSSSGPSRGVRSGPNYTCPTDDSASRPGIRASGVRSGTSVRLAGTSVAAPQLGRQLATSLNSPFLPHPTNRYNKDHRLGNSALSADPRVVGKE